jgi:hypothetical protein
VPCIGSDPQRVGQRDRAFTEGPCIRVDSEKSFTVPEVHADCEIPQPRASAARSSSTPYRDPRSALSLTFTQMQFQICSPPAETTDNFDRSMKACALFQLVAISKTSNIS